MGSTDGGTGDCEHDDAGVDVATLGILREVVLENYRGKD